VAWLVVAWNGAARCGVALVVCFPALCVVWIIYHFSFRHFVAFATSPR
jgi:hypothetical protein